MTRCVRHLKSSLMSVRVRRVSLAALVLAAIIVGGSVPARAVSPHADEIRQCQFNWLDAQTWTNREELRTARCAVDRWSVAGGLAKFVAVIDCESGWSRFAYNSAGPYVGLFQHDLWAWPLRVRAYEPLKWDLKESWSNARTAIVITARMVHMGGWGPWTCA
jgi:hypothetical protein